MASKSAGVRLQDVELRTLLVSIVVVAVASVYTVIKLLSHTPRPPFPEELQYQTADKQGLVLKKLLPKVTDEPVEENDNVLLSVVVPSYNETSRILVMLTEAIKYLKKSMPGRWEIIIVDDGSSDGTADYCLELSHRNFKLDADQLRVIKLKKNRGKGGAVRQGLLHIRGSYGLFADADGASNFSDVENLLEALQRLEQTSTSSNKAAVAIGSRAHMVNTDAVVKRSFIRNLLMYGLHTLVFVFGIRSIKDTQCGFKLFNKQAIVEIFPYLHTEGWIFDVEILMLAIRKSIPIAEVSISWHEVGGSKMDLARDSINMAKDLVVIRMAYVLGIYRDRLESASWH
ncbi:hypothetical protein HG536_0D03950 [Torulaspora globosa]|uniref:dolichyl-phosphate beta-glucosyltransferase n=1 Tax=Torulaspora globosa TaxID=48254 RepID=A0A7G3ZH87_9SACH|nr:uncharacterized protein HG536_0D03950 [Torulaspora globosa]QLL32873.1 hypothetical protein HG536_0D03950 [Torulaspora globosa]